MDENVRIVWMHTPAYIDCVPQCDLVTSDDTTSGPNLRHSIIIRHYITSFDMALILYDLFMYVNIDDIVV